MNIIITAPKHLGKSTAVAKIIKLLPGSISGFITEFIDRDCQDRALVLRSIDGSLQQNAVVWKNGIYEIDHGVFNAFAPSLVNTESDFVVIDELGKFEKNSDALRAAVTKAFDGPCHVIASIRLDAAGWMQELKNRSDVLVINLNEENRDSLPEFVACKLGIQ